MKRPNILLITTDQQRFDTVAACGNSSIFTPHLNWLADTGINFSRCFADCPVCAPSRATIMTGLHAWNHGQTGNNGATSPMAKHPTLSKILTRSGYQTRLIGKAHFKPQRAHYGFEHMELLADYFRWTGKMVHASPAKDHGVGENEMEPVFCTTEERFTQTHWTVEKSIDFLETRDNTRPFFLWSSFAKPHPPFDPLPDYWNLYEGIDLPDPVYGDWSRTQEIIADGFCRPTWLLNNIQRFSAQQLRATRRAYYACITQIDYNLGLLFARMRETGLLDNTWIIFTSDHGEMLGDHHLGAKSVFFEGSAHVPLLIRPPGGRNDGQKSDDNRLACLADLMPTILGEACPEETQRPELHIDGLNLMENRKREELYCSCEHIHCLITDIYKYHFAEKGAAELCFRMETDPDERYDIAASPTEAAIVNHLRNRLYHHLHARRHPAAGETCLISTETPETSHEVRRNAWPGFHHRSDATCDLLH